MSAISNRQPSVIIEYDVRAARQRKLFSSPYEARRFYVQKDKAGKNPKVLHTQGSNR
jgi:hypothetical protein